MKLLVSTLFVARLAAAPSPEKTSMSGASKRTEKRGVFGLGTYGALGGLGVGSAISLPFHGVLAGGHTIGHSVITKQLAEAEPYLITVPLVGDVPYGVPAPYPVPVEEPYSVAVFKQPVVVPVDKIHPVIEPHPTRTRVPHPVTAHVPYHEHYVTNNKVHDLFYEAKTAVPVASHSSIGFRVFPSGGQGLSSYGHGDGFATFLH